MVGDGEAEGRITEELKALVIESRVEAGRVGQGLFEQPQVAETVL